MFHNSIVLHRLCSYHRPALCNKSLHRFKRLRFYLWTQQMVRFNLIILNLHTKEELNGTLEYSSRHETIVNLLHIRYILLQILFPAIAFEVSNLKYSSVKYFNVMRAETAIVWFNYIVFMVIATPTKSLATKLALASE